MAKKQFPSSSQRSISPKRMLGTALSLVVFFLLLTSVIGLSQKYFTIKTRSKELAVEQNGLAQKETSLAASNTYLATPDGTEQSLRERYNYIKPGEEMIVITPDTTPLAQAPAATGVAQWWDELLRGLGIRK